MRLRKRHDKKPGGRAVDEHLAEVSDAAVVLAKELKRKVAELRAGMDLERGGVSG